MNAEIFRTLYKKFDNTLKYMDYIFVKRSKISGIIGQNQKFRDCHKGERCFILGNGPSLRTENLEVLEKEVVFTVNQFARRQDFQKVKPTYHFWADPLFFVIDETKEEDRELLDIMKKMGTYDQSIEYFFPVEQKSFVEKHKLDSCLRVNYYISGFSMYPKYKRRINYCSMVPTFGTVVQWCITMAVYMGFSEIYLLGCDNTGLMVNIKSALRINDNDDYGYEVTESVKKRTENQFSMQSLEQYVLSYLDNIQAYQYLVKYCNDRNVKLINCTSCTVIDSIPRMKLTDVL